MKKSYSKIGSIGIVFLLTALCSNAKAQTKTVTGTVTVGENQTPLSGVNVSQEGSDQVTQTNSKGFYILQINGENPIIIFRHPEYAEKRITVNGKAVINLSLDQKVQGIEEVVVNAGYYKVKEKESTGSIAKVSAKDIENQPVTNVLSSVQGRLAGVTITQNSGVPGGGYDIQIRGRNSLRNKDNSTIDGNQPLYVHPVLHKCIREACQQRGEAAWISGSDVIDGFDEAFSKELFPGSVDDLSCEVAVSECAGGKDILCKG